MLRQICSNLLLALAEARFCIQKGYQTLIIVSEFLNLYHSFLYLGKLRQQALYLTRLYPEAPELDLVIYPPK